MFKARTLLIATQHHKEKVIAPILEKELELKCLVAENIDTDLLGTFSGEIERKDNPIQTALNKCLMVSKQHNCDLILASEGSFGPHPSLFFVPANEELLLLLDRKNGLEFSVKVLSTETNFNTSEITSKQELLDFAQNAQFPSHALIMKSAKDDFSHMVKGIKNTEHLVQTFNYFIGRYGKAYIETDMRAMHNPTRMNVIEQAAKKLVAQLKNLCPICSTPGFAITEHKQGLPCERCHFPTRSTLSHIYTCQKCHHRKEEMYPKGIFNEDPMYCDYCNP